ncbi:MAG TPA: hypothetical protein VFZ73_04950 [Gemmatimonadaceae bacterium]
MAAGLIGCSDSPSTPGEPPPPPPPPPGTTILVDIGTQYQTMTGWQANAQAGQWEPGFAQWRDAVIDRAVADGINRLRVDVRSGFENPRDAFKEWMSGQITQSLWACLRYNTVNDNSAATSLDASRFSFSELDTTMVRVVLPMRQKLQAVRGEQLGLTMTYVFFPPGSCSGAGPYVHTDAEEYAEFAVAIMTHLRDRFGVIPDTWEVINEPDNSGGVWTIGRIEAAVLALDRRLAQAGFETTIVAPSHASAAIALNFAQALLSSPAASRIDQIGWHRYSGASNATVQALGAMAGARGIATAMTEHIGSDYKNLITDITIGRAATWEQYVLAYPETDNGAQYYMVQGSTVTTASRTKYLRHFFRHVRRGAVRIGASSASGSYVPVAFRNVNGRVVVVISYGEAGTITVGGLPAGRYSVGIESEATSDGSLPDLTVGTNGMATLNLESRGVIVLYGRGS